MENMETKPIEKAAEPAATTAAKQQRHKLTVAAFVVTVLAWVTLPLHYLVSLCLCVVGLALAIFGVRQPRGGSRNLALVTTVAAGVLLLVYAIFWAAMLFIAIKY